MLQVQWARLRARLALSERERRKTEDRCVPVRHPSIKRPDPLIYSQSYLMSIGLAVTWNNPDIQLFRGGAPVSSDDLQPSTRYEIVARIWNGSTEAPVVEMPVRFTMHGFGVGTEGTPIGEAKVDLGVKGSPGSPAFARIMWTTPAAPGHYCLRVTLDWPDDSNPNNNVGQENTNVIETASPARAVFRLRNDNKERERRYRFEVDTYSVPDREPCPRDPRREPTRTTQVQVRDAAAVGLIELPSHVSARHRRTAYPIPAGWTVQIEPEEITLGPDQHADVKAMLDPPSEFRGQQTFNINAFDETGLVGGVTIVVESA